MIRTDSLRGRVALMVGHCAGMVDLVALPVWVGTLVAQYGFDPQQAGMLVSLFLVGAVLASLLIAPRFDRLNGRLVAGLGYGLAALGFALASTRTDFSLLAVLHGLCGVAAGAGLSVTHGTVARSARPHRLFALVGIALGVFAVAFMGAMPGVVAAAGGPALFQAFAAVMAVGALAAALAFPRADAAVEAHSVGTRREPIPAAVWFGIAGIAGMALVQAMIFSFLERVGSDRGFGTQAITGVLVALALVNLLPAGLAALLEKRWPARTVMLTGPVVQALLAVAIMNSPLFGLYAAAASMFVAVMIFTHTFAFGWLARLDPSGRSMSATPAMLMAGAALGPIVGGTLVKAWGYGSLGAAAIVIGVLAVGSFSRIPRPVSPAKTQGVIA